MTSRQLATVVLKAMGIYFIFNSLGAALQVLTLFEWSPPMQGVDNPRLLAEGEAVYSLLLLAGGIVLLVNTRAVLELFFREQFSAPDSSPVNSFATQAIAFSVVGVLVLARAIPRAASWIVDAILLSRPLQAGVLSAYVARHGYSLAECLAEVAAGLWLFLGSRGLAAIWRRLQAIRRPYASLDPPAGSADSSPEDGATG